MTRALVTGASGFIGWHLTKALVARGAQVRGLARGTSAVDRLQALGIEIHRGDVTDGESLLAAVAGCDTVYHLAGVTHALDEVVRYGVNAEGARNIAAACAAQSTPPTLVVVSSLAAAGPSPPDRPRIECDPPSPISEYGRSKLRGERYARDFADRVAVTIVRPPIVFGEGDPISATIFRMAAKYGIHVLPTMQRTEHSIIHAADLAELLLAAAERGTRLPSARDAALPGQGIYFAAREPDVSYEEFGRLAARAVGSRWFVPLRFTPRTTRLSAAIATTVGRLLGRSPFFNVDKAREALAGSWRCSAAKAQRELGFVPLSTHEERMQQTAAWYRREGWL